MQRDDDLQVALHHAVGQLKRLMSLHAPGSSGIDAHAASDDALATAMRHDPARADFLLSRMRLRRGWHRLCVAHYRNRLQRIRTRTVQDLAVFNVWRWRC